MRRVAPVVPADAGAPASPDRGVPATSHARARWSASAASGPAPGSSSWSAATTDDPLFLQAKEAQASVLERFVGSSEHANHGQRVVVGQRLMQAASDIFLGWVRVKDLDGRSRDYYVRQLHDWKGGAEVETLRVPGAHPLRPAVRSDPCPRARALGRPDRDRLVPRQGRRLRPRDRGLLRRRTPTRTSGTTRRSPRPCARAGSKQRRASSCLRARADRLYTRADRDGGGRHGDDDEYRRRATRATSSDVLRQRSGAGRCRLRRGARASTTG